MSRPLREEASSEAALQVPPENLLPLKLEEAIVAAFEHNRSIDVSELDPEIADTFIDEARADFDPVLAADIRAGRNTQRIQTDNRTTGAGTIISDPTGVVATFWTRYSTASPRWSTICSPPPQPLASAMLPAE